MNRAEMDFVIKFAIVVDDTDMIEIRDANGDSNLRLPISDIPLLISVLQNFDPSVSKQQIISLDPSLPLSAKTSEAISGVPSEESPTREAA